MRSIAWSRVAWSAAAVAVLGLTLAAYLQPDMMVSLALQVWSCF
jgi:hypothetical protein